MAMSHMLAGGSDQRNAGKDSVLVAEDDPLFRRILEGWLSNWGYDVRVAQDGNRAWDLLQRDDAPQLIILDWIMPGLDGPEICRKMRAQERVPYPYILLVTSKDDKQDVIRGLEAGADDYLAKPFDIGELRARLCVGKRILQLQAELIRARDSLHFQATHDALTMAWNRAAVLDMLHRELDRARRGGLCTGALMLDLDYFKKVNDSYGHLTGDLVLREVAERIRRVIRSYDLVGRYGGEEFLVVISDCGRQEVLQSAERIRLAISGSPVHASGAEITITASIGAASGQAEDASEEQLIRLADAALYRAKRNGRNRVESAEC